MEIVESNDLVAIVINRKYINQEKEFKLMIESELNIKLGDSKIEDISEEEVCLSFLKIFA